MRRFIWFVLCIGLVLTPMTAAASGPTAGRSALPKFKLKDLKGKTVTPASLKGKVVVISFWATWCVPCKQELDFLEGVYKKEKDKGFEVLGIATDGPDTFSQIRGVVKRHRWTFPVLPDREGRATAALNPRAASPFSMYIDRQGRVAYDHEGFSRGDAPKIEARIKELLAEPAS